MSMVQPDDLRAQVLIVDDEAEHGEVMAEALRRPGHVCTMATTVAKALDELRHGTFDVVVTDLRMPSSAGAAGVSMQDKVADDGANAGLIVLRSVRALQPTAETIMVTAHGDVPTARAAFKEGVYDFIEKPLDLEVFRALINRAAETVLLRHEARGEQTGQASGLSELIQHEGFEGIIAGSEPMRRILRAVRSVAMTNLPVLVRGESGTGKELIAQAVHRLSPRGAMLANGQSKGRFVAINCAAETETLLDRKSVV